MLGLENNPPVPAFSLMRRNAGGIIDIRGAVVRHIADRQAVEVVVDLVGVAGRAVVVGLAAHHHKPLGVVEEGDAARPAVLDVGRVQKAEAVVVIGGRVDG